MSSKQKQSSFQKSSSSKEHSTRAPTAPLSFVRGKEVTDEADYPANLSRIALSVSYDGRNFHGWQRQTGRSERTVQGELEKGLTSIANEPVELVCAGRTDAGVHGSNQWVHFDTASERPLKAWVQGVNTRLPDDVKVMDAVNVSPLFHARFSATSRTYRYIVLNTVTPPVHLKGLVTWYRYPLNVDLLNKGAAFLLGEHDFTSFRGAGCQAQSPVREVQAVKWVRQGDYLVFQVTANAFLMHMVRNMVGSLLEIGAGRHEPEWIEELLAVKDRSAAAATAAPHGLYLVGVEYPEEYIVSGEPKGPMMIDSWL